MASLDTHTHGRHLPHLSYAVLRSWDLDRVRRALDQLGDRGPLELQFDALGTFRRGPAWLVPAVTSELALRQEAVVESLTGAGAELHRHYRPGVWIPHCTVAPRVGLSALPVVAAAVYEVLPLRVRADRAALVDSSLGGCHPLQVIP